MLRLAIRRLALPPAPATRLEQAVQELVPARPDARPLVRWPGAELRRYRDRLYVLPPIRYAIMPVEERLRPDGHAVGLGASFGRLVLERDDAGGIDSALVGDGLRIALREGGETIRPPGRGPTRALKKLLQEAGIVPWMRDVLPLLYAGERLVAVADLWIAEDARSAPGYAVRWVDKPALY